MDPMTTPTPQPAEAAAALAEALRATGHVGADREDVVAEVLAALPAGWTLTRDHARCEALRKENRRLRKALERIASAKDSLYTERTARAALATGTEEVERGL